jgi:hypothetical protein
MSVSYTRMGYSVVNVARSYVLPGSGLDRIYWLDAVEGRNATVEEQMTWLHKRG